MPTFTRDVPDDPRGPAFPIIRTPAHRPLVAIVTSEDLVGCYTHFYKGRTFPCEAPECDACKDGIPYRWHAYQSAYDPKKHFHFIFECTAQAGERFTDYRAIHNSLRGCLFEATRMHARHNARIIIHCKPADLTAIRLPKPPDIIKCLAILWDFPTTDIEVRGIEPEKKTKRIRHEKKGPAKS